MILTPESAAPRCTATAELLSRLFRPYLFEVTVTGEPPHACVRRYKIQAPDDDSAAISGLRLFVAEFSAPAARHGMLTLEPKAKLQ